MHELATLGQESSSSVTLLYQSDDLMEKLKLLDFEKQLLKGMKMKQLHRFYFVRSFNSGEQFFMFISICAWLIRLNGRHFDQPQEFDDPNGVISKIIKNLQEMDIQTDFSTTKLIQGSGPVCIYMMDCLAAQALKVLKKSFRGPDIRKEDAAVMETMDNDSEIILEKVEELNAFASDESDDEHTSRFSMNLHRDKSKHLNEYKIEKVADNEAWRMELEHVLPMLKIIVKADPRDWRAHLEQMKTLRRNIQNSSDEIQMQLKKLRNDILLTLEKISSREKHLNSDLEDAIQAYKQVSIEMQQLSSMTRENDQKKALIEQQLMHSNNELDNVKIQMEQRGNTMTDGSPLINIKKAIYRIKEEIMEMDIKIGVMQHTLNTEIMKQGSQYAELESMSLID